MAENIQRSSSGSSMWEYRAQTIGGFFGTSDELIEATLNEWGEDGWEAVNVYAGHGSEKVTIIAKRPLTSRTRRRRTMP